MKDKVTGKRLDLQVQLKVKIYKKNDKTIENSVESGYLQKFRKEPCLKVQIKVKICMKKLQKNFIKFS